MKAFVSTWKLIFMVFFGLNKLGKHVSRGDGQFYGGTLSNYIERHPDGTIKVTVQLISGWVLGKGPCGPGCGKGDIGRSTRSSRQQILNSNPGSLGNFTSDYINRFTKQTETKDLTTVVSRSNNETVIWVDEYEKFEQEILYFNLELQSAQDRLVIKYEGNSWRKISGLQLEHSRRWHFQTTILTAIRNDTGKPNSNPQALIKPFYRVKLGKVSEIRIPVIDSEGDFIRCYLASFIEAGDISLQPPPNVFVNENCSVYVNASESKNFTDDTWIAVPVSIRDFNKHDIMYGQDFLHAVSYSLSTVPVQFTVQVLANLLTPVFVEPTVESNHVFTLYPDTTWRIEVYVKATENCAIDELIVRIGLRKENFMISALQDDQRRPRVKHATISWTPSDNDSGQHLACVSAVDNTGVSSAEQRCFILDILAGAFHYRTNISLDRPYFVNIPSPNETVSCEVQKTCVVAIHIKSSLEVTDVLVTASFLDKYQLGPIQRVIHNGEQLYKVDLSFEHFMPGKEYICLTAVDKNRLFFRTICVLLISLSFLTK